MRRNLLLLSIGATVILNACGATWHRRSEEAHLHKESCMQCHLTKSPRSQPVLAREVSYSRDIQPIFNTYCLSCHGLERPAGGLSLASWDELANIGVIEAGNGHRSLFRGKLIGGDLPMAHRGVTDLTMEQIALIERWIGEGAKHN